MSLQTDFKFLQIKQLLTATARAVAFTCGVLLGHGIAFAQQGATPAAANGGTSIEASGASAKKPLTSRDRAWQILREGLE